MSPLLPKAVLAIHAREIKALTKIKVYATIDHSPMGLALLQVALFQPYVGAGVLSRTICGHDAVGVAQFATLSVTSFGVVVAS